MKSKSKWGFSVAMSVLMVGALTICLVLGAGAGSGWTLTLLDSFDIGDEGSEAGYNLQGWSDPWTWGGGYGGGDDGTFRLLMGPGDGCVGYEDAYFTMNANGAYAGRLDLRHLDGSQPDDFDVYIVEGGSDTKIGHYEQQTSGENWTTTEFPFSPRSGVIEFKLVATSPIGGWCLTWGQVAFSWAQLYSAVPVPVPVDIKPGSCPNPLNITDRGNRIDNFVVPVAILGTADFDVTEIDVGTIRLEGHAQPIRSSLEDVGEPYVPFVGKEDCDFDCNDYFPDGFMDLTLKFSARDVVDALGAVGDTECVVVHLTGSLFDGTPFIGEDVVRIINKG